MKRFFNFNNNNNNNHLATESQSIQQNIFYQWEGRFTNTQIFAGNREKQMHEFASIICTLKKIMEEADAIPAVDSSLSSVSSFDADPSSFDELKYGYIEQEIKKMDKNFINENVYHPVYYDMRSKLSLLKGANVWSQFEEYQEWKKSTNSNDSIEPTSKQKALDKVIDDAKTQKVELRK